MAAEAAKTVPHVGLVGVLRGICIRIILMAGKRFLRLIWNIIRDFSEAEQSQDDGSLENDKADSA